MGALRFFWNAEEVDLWVKVKIYCACVLTILLWGAETWAPTVTNEARLESFHHRSIRLILQINMIRVCDERIKNEDVRKMFQNIETIRETMRIRKLTFVGHVVRERKFSLTALTASINLRRPRGQPRCTACLTMFRHLHNIIPDVIHKDGLLSSWTCFTLNRQKWSALINGTCNTEDFNDSDFSTENPSQTPPPPPPFPPSSPAQPSPPSTPPQNSTSPSTPPTFQSPPPSNRQQRQRRRTPSSTSNTNHELLGVTPNAT